MGWRVTIQKYHTASGRYWTNVYNVAANDMANATNIANTLVTNERNLHLPVVQFTNCRVDDGVPNTDVTHSFAINQPGLSSKTGDVMPLFVVARVDFNVTGSGRPSRKYYRGVLTESMVAGMLISDEGWRTATSTGLTTNLSTLMVDPQNQQFSSVVINPVVGMRQLKRGSKKKVTQ